MNTGSEQDLAPDLTPLVAMPWAGAAAGDLQESLPSELFPRSVIL